MAGIQDFGEKIGGARKDVWRLRGLGLMDLDDMNPMERKSNIKKDNIWIRPNWEKVIQEGTPQAVAYWQNKMRQALPPRPAADDEVSQENYIEVVEKIRDAVMVVRDPYEISNFYKGFIRKNFVEDKSSGYYVTIVEEAKGIVNNKVLRAAQSNYQTMKREAEKKLFGIPKDEQAYVATVNRMSVHQYDGDKVTLAPNERSSSPETILTIASTFGRTFYYLRNDKEFMDISQWEEGKFFVMDNNTRRPLKINFDTFMEAKEYVDQFAKAAQKMADERETNKSKGEEPKRKQPFVPKQLRNIHRKGPDYRKGRQANGDLFMKDFGFRGGEFGNWLNDNDRQTSLNMAYDGLRDLARLLEIRPHDIALNNSLAIAFGARGRGGANAASAHYEPDLQVINLTKMSGAGCLAHEWAHALDHAIGLAGGATGLASEAQKVSVPASFKELLNSLQYKKVILQGEEISSELSEKVEHSKRNLKNWISSVKPRNLPDDMAKAWDNAAQAILDSANTFTGAEYMKLRRIDTVITKPEVELLSQIRKSATNHAIPLNEKRQIAMWALDLGRNEAQAAKQESVERTVKTDFYKGSIQFDAVHSRAGHGYWQSTCEMFARAFDCYIADKIKASGVQSEYLSAYADAFIRPGENGEMIAAIPQGEERAVINKNFDKLLEDIKELGILQHYEEQPEITAERAPARRLTAEPEPKGPVHYEQMSLEDLLFSAESKKLAQQHNSKPQRDVFQR